MKALLFAVPSRLGKTALLPASARSSVRQSTLGAGVTSTPNDPTVRLEGVGPSRHDDDLLRIGVALDASHQRRRWR
jgi:hypothetical protein